MKKFLNLEREENLIIENGIEENQNEKIIKAYSFQHNKKCIQCGSKDIVKNGTYKGKILLTKFNNKKIIMKITKQKYLCNNCKKMFLPKLKFLRRKARISECIKKEISIELSQSLSNTQIARNNFVSPNTVERILKKNKSVGKNQKSKLPKIICVDEFKGVKNYKNKMNFLIVDGEKAKIKDILINRQKITIEKYFLSFKKEARKKVEFFVSDMYDTYINTAKKYFTNSKIIIDRFHTKRLMVNCVRNKRIQIMKKYPKYTYQYRVFRKFKNLLLKRYEQVDINYKKIKYYEMFGSEYDILMYMLSLDKQLQNMYWIYQEFVSIFDTKDTNKFKKFISKDYTNISEEMKQVIKTYRKYEEYIINSLKYPYSNGICEGINNKIKLIKRIAYGFRNFENFKLKIFYVFNFIKDTEDIKRKEEKRIYKIAT